MFQMGGGAHLRGERSDERRGSERGEVHGHLPVPVHERSSSPGSHFLTLQVRIRRWISTSPG